MAVLAEPRQQAILQLINSGGQAVVSDLARRFSVSEMTIRRDLKVLENMGLAVRVHGGAVSGEKSRFTSRLSLNARAKGRAAEKLAGLLPAAGCVYFDGSTTILNLVRYCKGMSGLQVATNNVETFNRLVTIRGPSPILIGGSLDLRTDNLIGPLAIRSVEALVFERAFFSAWGITPESGLNEATMEDASVKEEVVRRSQAVLVALDGSKFGVVGGGVWNHGGAGKSVLATDLSPESAHLDAYRSLFGQII